MRLGTPASDPPLSVTSEGARSQNQNPGCLATGHSVGGLWVNTNRTQETRLQAKLGKQMAGTNHQRTNSELSGAVSHKSLGERGPLWPGAVPGGFLEEGASARLQFM